MGTEGRRKLMFIVNTETQDRQNQQWENPGKHHRAFIYCKHLSFYLKHGPVQHSVWKPSVYSSTQVRSFVQLVQKMNWWENNHRNQHNCFFVFCFYQAWNMLISYLKFVILTCDSTGTDSLLAKASSGCYIRCYTHHISTNVHCQTQRSLNLCCSLSATLNF